MGLRSDTTWKKAIRWEKAFDSLNSRRLRKDRARQITDSRLKADPCLMTGPVNLQYGHPVAWCGAEARVPHKEQRTGRWPEGRSAPASNPDAVRSWALRKGAEQS